VAERTTRASDVAERTGPGRRERLDAARLYLIIDAEPHGRPAAEIVGPALAGGVDMVQLREKELDEEAVLGAADELRELCDDHGALLILNDRPDLAVECVADGVHLGQADASTDEARAVLGADGIVGVSTHTREEIEAAGESLADYIGVGPVHATPTKPGTEPVGEELVCHAADAAGRPFFAVGGIDVDNARAVAGAGARRIAVIRAIRDARDPRAAATALREAIVERAASGERR
jgi:thiamine-phosphate pyrophosphorylase